MSSSEDMQEFLALNSDASRYFGRRPFVKSRIDKVRKIYLFILIKTDNFQFHPWVTKSNGLLSISLMYFFSVF